MFQKVIALEDMEFSDKIGEQRGSYTRVPTTCQGDASLCQACPCLAGQNLWTGAPDVVGPVNGLPPTTWRGATCMYLEVPGSESVPNPPTTARLRAGGCPAMVSNLRDGAMRHGGGWEPRLLCGSPAPESPHEVASIKQKHRISILARRGRMPAIAHHYHKGPS